MPLSIQLFVSTAGPAQHPSCDLAIPNDFKILGGGALDHYNEPGNMLTACYPKSLQLWSVAGKDHQEFSPASITAYALAIHDPNNEWDVVITQQTSDPAQHPNITATLPDGYILTGGGAFVNYGNGYGNILTATFPSSQSTWEARSKDHLVADPAQLTAYAIGIRHRDGAIHLQGHIQQATGAVAQHPNAMVTLDAGWTLTGGGALDNWEEPGNLLTATYPQGTSWIGAGKDHIEFSPASITAYVLGIRTV